MSFVMNMSFSVWALCPLNILNDKGIKKLTAAEVGVITADVERQSKVRSRQKSLTFRHYGAIL